jgi:putative chitinase
VAGFLSYLLAQLRGYLGARQGGAVSPPVAGGGTEGLAPSPSTVASGVEVAPEVPAELPGQAPAAPDFFLSSVELAAIMPRLTAGPLMTYLPFLTAAMQEFAVTSPLRAAAFLAQVAEESAGLTAWSENLNYGAPGLLATFPSHFDAQTAAAYARQPERIANRVYANRMGNGDEASGDGWRYRGRGPIGLTFADNYREYGVALGVDLLGNPDLAATPAVGFRIAGRYFAVNGCRELADDGTDAAFIVITRRVNGGLTGLASREAYYARAREVLGA